MKVSKPQDLSLAQTKAVHDSKEDSMFSMLQELKLAKDRFGFMEYFFAGIMYSQLNQAQQIDSPNSKCHSIISQIADAKQWSKKMELNLRQKSLYYWAQFYKDEPSVSPKAPQKPVEKRIEILEKPLRQEVKQVVNAPVIPHIVEEPQGSAFDDDFVMMPTQIVVRRSEIVSANKRVKISEDEEATEELNIDDLDTLVKEDYPDAKAAEENKEKVEHNEPCEDVVCDCKICLDDIQMNELYCLDIWGHMFHNECIETHLKVSIGK